MTARWVVGLSALLGVTACAPPTPQRGFNPAVPTGATRAAPASHDDLDFARGATAPRVKPDQVGSATWYGAEFAGKPTANGERFDPSQMTAAHRTLPFGTWVEVRRVDTGRAVRVRINDRGPWGNAKRIIDVSRRAAEHLDLVRVGVARVELRVVHGP